MPLNEPVCTAKLQPSRLRCDIGCDHEVSLIIVCQSGKEIRTCQVPACFGGTSSNNVLSTPFSSIEAEHCPASIICPPPKNLVRLPSEHLKSNLRDASLEGSIGAGNFRKAFLEEKRPDVLAHRLAEDWLILPHPPEPRQGEFAVARHEVVHFHRVPAVAWPPELHLVPSIVLQMLLLKKHSRIPREVGQACHGPDEPAIAKQTLLCITDRRPIAKELQRTREV
mmetsp:Transcript_85963/g.188839  ORF Transcript_85963/g.188839 Transcript_85963/m.188839 type:complete len:224 (-) Transcript_85963:380-1051(-)